MWQPWVLATSLPQSRCRSGKDVEQSISILVVDDEPALRRLMQAYLGRLGHQVQSCGDATSALKLVEENPAAFRVVIADLTLPDMRGDEMSQRILEMCPGTDILVCSGYPIDLDTFPPEQRHRVAMLQKPFLPDMLKSAIGVLLSRNA